MTGQDKMTDRDAQARRCTICGSPLDMPGRPWTQDCGGDCLACMADCGDPDAISVMRKLGPHSWTGPRGARAAPPQDRPTPLRPTLAYLEREAARRAKGTHPGMMRLDDAELAALLELLRREVGAAQADSAARKVGG